MKFAQVLFALLIASSVVCISSLTVHLVCHSHDDVGWQITVDEYYAQEVHNIIDTVVSALAENKARKFIYVEQAFFQRWWRLQNSTRQDLARSLVAAGQLEFVNGGWCMHDEAGTHYVDMIDQTTLGHRYISQQFGVQPTVTWQIDPFGHSGTQATLFGPLSGMDGVFFERIDYQDKNIRDQAQTLEMVWRSSASLGANAQTFAGAFAPGYGYQSPSGMCWDKGCRNPPIQNNKSQPGYNLDTFVNAFVSLAQKQAAMTHGENVMWTLGDDFQYQDAESWYPNLDKLIDGVNADGRVQTLYSTPSIYLAAKNAEKLSWPLKTDDFFPYADGDNNYWTGYFTSRPALKRYVRFTSQFLQVARHFEIYTGANGDNTQQLWEAQGVAQHHDAVAGTAKQAVTYDYAQRLSEGYAVADAFVGMAVGNLVTKSGNAPTFMSCPLTNVSVCSVTQKNNNLVVVTYNPLARSTNALITVPFSVQGTINVYDSNGNLIPSQNGPVMQNLARVSGSAPYQVQFMAEIAGLGYSTYFVNYSSSESSPIMPSVKSVPITSGAEVTIQNDFWTLTFDKNGLLSSAAEAKGGNTISISQSFLYYNSFQGGGQDSGAYIFRPDQSNATAVPVATSVDVTVVTGSLTQEVRQVYSKWLTQIVRLTMGSPVIEFEWTVGHIPVGDNQGKEIITRFTTSINSASTWYTDSNGREFEQRTRNSRPTWKWNPTQITAGNYFPCNAVAWIADSNQGMAVLNDRSQGCSSLVDGQLEFMVHRRLLKDDGRGVGEPLNEPGLDGQGLTVTGSHYLVFASPSTLLSQVRPLATRVFSPPYVTYTPLTTSVSGYISSHNVMQSFLQTALPANLELMTLQVSDSSKNIALVRISHQFGVGEDSGLSVPVTFDLGSLFTQTVNSVTELTLTANQAVGAHKGYQWNIQNDRQYYSFKSYPIDAASFNVTINPAEIRTFNVTFASSKNFATTF